MSQHRDDTTWGTDMAVAVLGSQTIFILGDWINRSVYEDLNTIGADVRMVTAGSPNDGWLERGRGGLVFRPGPSQAAFDRALNQFRTDGWTITKLNISQKPAAEKVSDA